MANTWVTTPLNYTAFGGELPSCDILTGAQGDIAPSFPALAALLRPRCGFIIVTGVSWGLSPCPVPGAQAGGSSPCLGVTGGCFAPLPWQSLPLHTLGMWDIPRVPTAPQGPGGRREAMERRGARLLPHPQHPGALRDWANFGRVLFWRKAGRKSAMLPHPV